MPIIFKKTVFGHIPDDLSGVVKNDLAGLIGLAQQMNPNLVGQMLTTEIIAERLKGFGFPMPMGKSILDHLVTVGSAPELHQNRLTGLLFLLNASDPLTRIGAALGLPWFMDRKALDPLRQAARDSDANVRRAAQWAFAALERIVRSQP